MTGAQYCFVNFNVIAASIQSKHTQEAWILSWKCRLVIGMPHWLIQRFALNLEDEN